MLADEIIDYWDAHGLPGKVGFLFREGGRCGPFLRPTVLQYCSETITATKNFMLLVRAQPWPCFSCPSTVSWPRAILRLWGLRSSLPTCVCVARRRW